MRLLAFLTFSICAFAQADKARLIGTVADSTGAVIPSAAITIKDTKTGLERQASSDDRGFFAITNLSPSTYTVIAKSNGLGRLAFWSVNRDRGCAGGGVVSNCSGIAQGDWDFTRITAGF